MQILVTGAAGFIGFALCKRLCEAGHSVVGIDNLNDYYSVQLKKDRLAQLESFKNFEFKLIDLSDTNAMRTLFSSDHFERVVNLAAQAGVRYSLQNPHAYVESNLLGFLNILEGCRNSNVEHLVYASSSSVYGLNREMPFSEHHCTDHPVSLYAATKKSNEMMAHAYSHLYAIPTTGLRFFTVYGPWGRPDMALFIFTKAIFEGKPIPVFNGGNMVRDFTYIDDIVEGVIRVMDVIPQPDASWNALTADIPSSSAPYRLYNIGNNNSEKLGRFIEVLEKCIGIKANIESLPMQPGDVVATYADIDDLRNATGFSPATEIETGIARFVEWYRSYYKV